jgi:hypothetical protein
MAFVCAGVRAKGKRLVKASRCCLVRVDLIGRRRRDRRTVERLLDLDVKDLFKGKALAGTLRMFGFFWAMDPDKCGLEGREFVLRENRFGDRVVDGIKHTLLEALQRRVVEPLTRHSFGLTVDGVDGIIRDFRTFKDTIVSINGERIELLDLGVGDIKLAVGAGHFADELHIHTVAVHFRHVWLVEPHHLDFGRAVLDVAFGDGTLTLPGFASLQSRELSEHDGLLILLQSTNRLDVAHILIASREVHEEIVDSHNAETLECLLVDGIDTEMSGEKVVGGHRYYQYNKS